MKNELFDNPNDWLAEQRREESKSSAWDIDDAQKLKEEHAKRHERENRYQQKIKVGSMDKTKLSNSKEYDANYQAKNAIKRIIRLIFMFYFATALIQFLAFFISSGFLSELIYYLLAS